MRWLPLVLLGCAPAGDEPPGGGQPTSSPVPSGVTFADVEPLLAASCAPCHVNTTAPSAGLWLEHPSQVVEVLHPATGLDLVAPGSPDDSYLWHKLMDTHSTVPGGDGGVMPPGGMLPDDELAQVRAWIEGGALGDGSDPPEVGPCIDSHPGCEGDCDDGPASVTDADWHHRLTESPEISWDPVPAAVAYEVSVGTEPGTEDGACWTDVGAVTDHTFRALWVLEAGQHYVASVRAVFADDSRSDWTASDGWTVDIEPPDEPTDLLDDRLPVDGWASWDHPVVDDASGFSHFELAVGTAPGGDDAVPWFDAGPDVSADLAAEVGGLADGAWYWLAVRAVDVAGNRSRAATSVGFIPCPAHFAFVPSDDELGSTPFCLARYEMRIEGNDDGSTAYDPDFVPESRPTGTPWASMDKDSARVACDAMGFSYQLVTNTQWQAAARSIERTDSNWSGGVVGSGIIPRGHSDESPLAALSSDGDPCVGTGNPACEDPGAADFGQRRTHDLDNGDVVWDLAGNLSEQVDGSTGGPDGLWMSFDGSAFTTDPGWEDYRLSFAPAGDYTELHGMGRMYGGTGNLTRGGAYDHASPGSAGSDGDLDTGVFQAHHNSWSTGITNGFRCVFVPM